MIKTAIIMVLLLLLDYWYFLEDFNSVKLFFPVEHEKRGRHKFVKMGPRKVLPRFACLLIFWR